MKEIIIKKEEIEDGESFVDIKIEESLLVKDEISQEGTESYKYEFDHEMKIEKHEFWEESNCDMSDSTYPKKDDAQFYPVCKKLNPDSQEAEYMANEGEKIKSVPCKVSKKYKTSLKSNFQADRCKTKPFKCSKYDYSCAHESKILRHVRAVHDKEKPFKCSECDYSCARKSSMTVHVRAVHDKVKPFKCSECDYSCARKSSMTIHVSTVHDKEKPFKCNDCDYSCTSKSILTMHVRTAHEKEKPFKCSDCDYSCAQKAI